MLLRALCLYTVARAAHVRDPRINTGRSLDLHRATIRPANTLNEEADVRHIRIGVWLCGVILLTTGRAYAAPCIAAAECSEWVSLPQTSARVLVYRSFPLGVKNLDVTRALVVVHGAGRDADNYFRHALAAAFLAGALENTLVVSPRFASTNGNSCADKVSDREATWQCSGPSRWTAGGGAVDNSSVTSFDVIDEILRTLAHKEAFPNLRAMVLAGHSAGGQFVSRYQMANLVHDTFPKQ